MRLWTEEEMKQFLFESMPAYESYVCLKGETVLGWAAFTRYQVQENVLGTVEMSVYVHQNARRNGVGSTLCRSLLRRATTLHIHSVFCLGFRESTAHSFAQKCGFTLTGCFPKFFSENGNARDIMLYERLIDL
ncbi:GNAT family N-acetyltransferase [Bradyrhizobium sp. DOA9]|uniref:GNAT family N-acetyltransferase n=1 Tax=Bradyrhizobium sp. DOA9 TaxID=1126627 RepID=UPI0030EDBBC7